MAAVFMTYVYPDGSISRSAGETVTVGQVTYVKREYLDGLLPSTGWYASREEADQAAIATLEKKIAAMTATIDSLRPLPAGNQAAAFIGGGGSARGGREVTPQPGAG